MANEGLIPIHRTKYPINGPYHPFQPFPGYGQGRSLQTHLKTFLFLFFYSSTEQVATVRPPTTAKKTFQFLLFTSFSRFVSKRDGQRGVCRSSSLCGLRELANHRKFETLRSVVIYLSEDEGVYVCVTYRKERQPFSWGQLNEFFFRLLREGEEELKKELYIIYKKPKKERRLKNKREEKREKKTKRLLRIFNISRNHSPGP